MKLAKCWYQALSAEFEKPYFKDLREFLDQEKKVGHVVYPPEDLIFNAFYHTRFSSVKVVLIGQDPYHGPGQAHGLSFSVPEGIPLPPSLKNIFLEINQDLKIPLASQGSLISWAKQGVLLLNTTLTVRSKEPKSHFGKGWETFTDAVVNLLIQREDPLIFVLWGKSAQAKLEKLSPPHVALIAAHPSPYSAYSGFFGCRHFSKINELLLKWGKEPINWNL